MVFDFIKADFTIPSRKFASVVILVSTSFAWLFLLFNFFDEIFPLYVPDLGTVYNGYFLFLGVAVISAIIGTVLSERINRRKFLISWIVIGLLANISLVFIQELGLVYFYFISVVLGISIGLGFPSCLAFLADCTAVGERARVTGIVLFMTLVIGIISYIVIRSLNFGIGTFILFSAVKGIGLLAFVSGDCERRKSEKTRSWRNVFASKDFVLYLFPWLMFSLAGSLNELIFAGLLVLPEYLSVDLISMVLHYLIWAVCSLVAGIMADRVGRKQPIMIGLISLGVSYAILSIFTDPITFVLYQVLSGVAWGFIFTVYVTLLGDLASYGSKEKFYVMGAIMPLILTMSLTPLISLLYIKAPITFLSPIYSLILFLSVFPVLRATETLSSRKIQDRKLKDHLEKGRKFIAESKKQN